MAIVVTNINTGANTSGATLALSSVTVPAGSLIFVSATDQTGFATGSVADGVNTYTRITGVGANAGASPGISVFYAKNATLTGGTITYTKGGAAAKATLSAFYATGIDTTAPLDSSVTNTASGSGASPSVAAAGAPSVAGDLIVGVAVSSNVTNSWVQDSANGAYANPPNFVASTSGAGSQAQFGGYLVNSGTSPNTYAPTSPSASWGIVIVAFKADTAAAGQPTRRRLGGVPYAASMSSPDRGQVFGPSMSLKEAA